MPTRFRLPTRYKGRKPFNKPHNNVCNVASLYPQYFQFVVLADSGINKISDLKGKIDHHAAEGQHRRTDHRHFLQANGLSWSDVKVSRVGYTDSVNQMKDGQAVAFGLNTQAPAGAVMDLAAARDIKMFEQTDAYQNMLKLNPSYKLITLPKGTYPKQDKDLTVIGFFDARRGVLQAAGGRGLHHDQDDRRQYQDACDRRQGDCQA